MTEKPYPYSHKVASADIFFLDHGFEHLRSKVCLLKCCLMSSGIISDDIAELNRNHTTTVAKIAEHKRKLLELQHRVSKELVHQEITRKMGYAIQADEEQLRIKFEAIQAELSAPTQFKGHLKEFTSQIRMQNYQTSVFEGERYSIDEISKEEIRE
ncbi:Nucleoporin p54, partial [Araneus ventricosus]